MHLRLSNGLALAYHVRGAGRLVMFLHPIGTRGAFWDPAVQRLQEHCRCVTVDLRGHGDSDVPRVRFTLGDLADDVIELLRVERASDAVLVGCSLGGMVAQHVALKAPELLSGLVLADTGYRQTPESRQALLQRAEDALQGMPAMVQSTLARWFPARFLALSGPEVEACRDWLLEDDPVVFAWGWHAIGDLDIGDRLAGITIPTLVLRGSLDASSARETMQAMAKLLPRARHAELEGAGHVAPLEQPDAFAALLLDFLAQDVAG
ncbi:MAG TPA: alpha/beta fold hydrolase [Stellaceae bacterium]|jgi:3-oxoadipate enol-lactonase|nr:alpha/beta fold hydrolase [Stellaceae bacterium]